MDKVKLANKTLGCTALGLGIAAKLAGWGLNAAEVVLNGAANLANEFVKAPNLGIGKALFGTLKKGVGTLEKSLIDRGKEWTR